MRGHGLCGRIRFIWSGPASTESCNPDSRGLDSCGVCGGGAPEKVCWAATTATILITDQGAGRLWRVWWRGCSKICGFCDRSASKTVNVVLTTCLTSQCSFSKNLCKEFQGNLNKGGISYLLPDYCDIHQKTSSQGSDAIAISKSETMNHSLTDPLTGVKYTSMKSIFLKILYLIDCNESHQP